MKPRILVVALLAAFGSGCTSMDKPGAALRMEPVMAIRHGGPDAQSYYQLGRYHQGQKRLALAEKAYLQAIAADERNVDAFNALGSLYAERGELERAAQTFQKATVIAPGVAYLRNNLGFAYYLQGRLEQAYLEVRTALSLDPGFERGWANLERIAAAGAQTTLIAATKLRRLEALPSELAAQSIHDDSLVGPEPSTLTQSPTKSDLALQAPMPAVDRDAVLADSADLGKLEAVAVDTAAAVTQRSAPTEPTELPAPETENRIFGGKFVLVSADRELVSNGGTIEIFAEKSAAIQAPSQPQIPLPAVRIEVSNGNGVNGFARKVGSQLRSNQLLVTRITNHASFSLETTEIQFEPRHEDAARALASRFNLTGRFVPTPKARPGADIRIVLGHDAIQPSWLANAFGSMTKI